MTKFPIPDTALANHIAAMGKTGAGKTSTEKLIIEHAVEEGDRVCILDPIKSDWWGITSSGDGKKPGLPFTILGGPHGSLPLHPSSGKALGQLVGSGKLPLSILDMADFEKAGDLQGFFSEFAASLMRHMRGVLYLVLEEAHEFAPKERAGFGNENQAIHFAKKLATAGRSKGIRLIVATQRVQALHNAVLGSCETLIAHRLTTAADQDPVLKWVKANAGKDVLGEVTSSLSSLPTGTAWVVSGEAQMFERIAFPKFTTFDNTATPDRGDGEQNVVTAKVDEDALREILGDAVEQAKANDPKLLKAEVARLTKELTAARATTSSPADKDRISELERQVTDTALLAADRAREIRHLRDAIKESIAALTPLSIDTHIEDVPPPEAPIPARLTPIQPPRSAKPAPVAPTGDLSGPQATFMSALSWWAAMGHKAPTRAQVAAIAGWRITSGHLKNVAGGLRTGGLIDYPQPGHFALTDEGRSVAPQPDMSASLHDSLRVTLTGPQRLVFDDLLTNGRSTREEMCDRLGWSPTSGHVKNVLGSMRTLEILDYPAQGSVELRDWVTA